MADEVLSSGATRFYKGLLWYLAIQGVVLATILGVVFNPLFALVAIPTVGTAAAFFPIVRGCTRVVASDTGLRVGAEGAEKLVPYTQIRRVTTFRFSNPRVVTVETADGKIRFFAPLLRGFNSGWAEPPSAKLIRDRAKLSA